MKTMDEMKTMAFGNVTAVPQRLFSQGFTFPEYPVKIIGKQYTQERQVSAMYYFMINPASRSGRGIRIWHQLERVLIQRQIPYRAVFSRYAGHITRLTAQLTAPDKISGYRKKGWLPLKLVILGGDGTMNEALQGILDFEQIQLGYIPIGSSNDLARDLGLPRDPVVILDCILNCTCPRPTDIGILTHGSSCARQAGHRPASPESSRYFAVSSGIGFDAAVCERILTSRSKKMLNRLGLGKLTYLAVALKELFSARRSSCDLYLDGSDTPIHIDHMLFSVFMIRKYEGGGFQFCPMADDTDGKLDLCIAGNLPLPLILIALPTAFFGRHYIFPSIRHYRAASARLEVSHPLWVHTDGEVIRQSDTITLSCLHKKIQLLF